MMTMMMTTTMSFRTIWCDTIPIVEALAYGALISSIDPIAVLSVLSNMGMTDTDTIYVIIFGESLLNDGVALVLFETLAEFLDESMVIDVEAVVSGTIRFVVVAFGSLFVGIASGVVGTCYFWRMQGCQTPLVEVLLFFCWAFLPYYVCDGIGWSGIVGVVATGFVMDLFIVGERQHRKKRNNHNKRSTLHIRRDDDVDDEEEEESNERKRANSSRRRPRSLFYKKGHLSDTAKTHIGFVGELMATMMETVIFAYLGVFLFSHRYHWNVWHIFLALLACCVSRAITIPTLSFVANRITTTRRNAQANQSKQQQQRPRNNNNGVIIDGKMQVVLWIAGLRGAMSFALVETIPLYDSATGRGSKFKAELKAMTSATIVFTVFVLGGYTYYLMQHMGMTTNSSSKHNHDSESGGRRRRRLRRTPRNRPRRQVEENNNLVHQNVEPKHDQ